MVATPNIQVSQGLVLSVTSGATPEIDVSQAFTFAVANFPTENINNSQSFVTAITGGATPNVEVSQAFVMVVCRGRVDNSRLRAWTFSLDGHDYYVLRLGDDVTLVYDVYSEQWVDWSSFEKTFWRPNVGMNWVGAAALANTYGSDVLVGDDTYGLLWFLDPEQSYDEHPDALWPVQEQYFERITMGQFPVKGREAVPCYAAWLTTDMGDPAYTGAGVTLSISDDAGQTFDDMGTVTVTAGEYSPELSWYSLGQIEAPGRLFKIVDDGAVTRIDGLEMNDAG